jgi:hypothetical protein
VIKLMKIGFLAAIITPAVTFAVPTIACNGNGNCENAPGHNKGVMWPQCLAPSPARDCRSSLLAMARTGLCADIGASPTGVPP